MADVKYLFGTQEAYDSQASHNEWAFYKTPKNLYLGDWQLTNAEDINHALELIGDLSTLRTNDKKCLVNAINEIINNGVSVVEATDTIPGIVKLYSSVGQSLDGTMTQRAITEALAKKAEIKNEVNDETLCINIKED